MRPGAAGRAARLAGAAALWLGAVRADGVGAAARLAIAFPVGEDLTYKVQWGAWVVAESRVHSEWIEEDGRRLLLIRIASRTKNVMAAIYPVDDVLESVVDPDTFLPVRFTKRLSEGRYRLHEITTFDHARGKALWRHLLRGDRSEFDIEPDTRDLVSFMFYMRGQRFEPGTHYEFRVMADEKLYDLLVDARAVEQRSVGRFGRVRMLKLDPDAKFHGLFVRVGKLEVWISDDDRCLCVQAVARAPVIGSVRLLIDRVEGPGDDFWTRPGEPGIIQKPRSPAPSAGAPAPGRGQTAGEPQNRREFPS